MVNLSEVVKEGLSSCREVEAIKHERFLFDLGSPQHINEQVGFGIRVNFRGNVGFAWDEGQATSSQLLRQAIQNAKGGAVGDFSRQRLVPMEEGPPPPNIDNAIESLTLLARELHLVLPTFFPERSFTINAQIVRDVFSLANRLGTQRDERLVYLLTLRSHQGPSILATSYTTQLPDKPDEFIFELMLRHSISREVAALDTNTVPVLFSSNAAGQLWEDFVQSSWVDNGTQTPDIFNIHADFNVYDNGLLPGGLGTTRIDGEGLPRQRLALAVNGQVTAPLRDLQTAHKRRQAPQGSAVRSWGCLPRSGYTNIEVLPGTKACSELLQEMGDGVWVDYLTPLPTVAPHGIFQRRASIAYLVRQGRPVARLPQMVIQGVYRDMLGRNMRALGLGARIHGRTKVPPMLIDNMHLFTRDITEQEEGIDLPRLWW